MHPHSLEEIVSGLSAVNAEGVLLVGSRAVGEHDRNNDFGDLDLYVWHEGVEAQAEISYALRDYPVAHATVLNTKSVRVLPRTFRLFEAKAVGKSVWGLDFRPRLPDIDVGDLDYGDLNDILSWRLLSVSKARGHKVAAPALSYAAAKNRLDLGIWLAAQLGHLVPTHQNRIDLLRRLDTGGSVTSHGLKALLADWVPGIDEALRVKTGRTAYERPERELDRTQELLGRAGELTLRRKVPYPELSDRRIRRRAAVLRNMVRTAEVLPLPTRVSLVAGPHRAMLHSATQAALGDRRAAQRLGRLHSVVYGGIGE